MGKPFKDKLKNVGDFISGTIAEVTELTGRTSGIFIQGVQGHKWIEETLHFWNPKILRMPYGMQYHLVEILTHLALLQAVLQKHFMEFRMY